MMVTLKKALTEALRQLAELPLDTLLEQREDRSSPTASTRRSPPADRLPARRGSRSTRGRRPARSTPMPRQRSRDALAAHVRRSALRRSPSRCPAAAIRWCCSTRSSRVAPARGHRAVRRSTSITACRRTPTRGRRSAQTLCAARGVAFDGAPVDVAARAADEPRRRSAARALRGAAAIAPRRRRASSRSRITATTRRRRCCCSCCAARGRTASRRWPRCATIARGVDLAAAVARHRARARSTRTRRRRGLRLVDDESNAQTRATCATPCATT